jgi:hypothetical protein
MEGAALSGIWFAGLSRRPSWNRGATAGHSAGESAVLNGIKWAAALAGWGPVRRRLAPPENWVAARALY